MAARATKAHNSVEELDTGYHDLCKAASKVAQNVAQM